MKQRALLLLATVATLAFMLAATGCTAGNLSDRQIALSQAGLAAAEIGLNVAEMQLADKLADPDTPAWQLLVAQQSVDLARKELIKARTRLEQAERRECARHPGVVAAAGRGLTPAGAR